MTKICILKWWLYCVNNIIMFVAEGNHGETGKIPTSELSSCCYFELYSIQLLRGFHFTSITSSTSVCSISVLIHERLIIMTIWFRMLKYELCWRKMLAHIKPANITMKNWKNEKVSRKENKMKKNRWFVCHFVWWVSLHENRIKYCKEQNFDNSVLY